MELEAYLDILLALREGPGSPARVAERTGITETEAHQQLGLLTAHGFVDGIPGQRGAFQVSPLGRRLLETGYEECYKRALTDRLGGDDDSAS